MRSAVECRRFLLALVSVGLVYLALAAAGDPCTVTTADGSLVPERYVTRRSNRFDSSDPDPDMNCTPQGSNSVSCPAPGRLFDDVEPPANSNATRHLFHVWRSTESGDYVEVELVFCWPVIISAMKWYFWQDNDAYSPSRNWSITAVSENGRNISQYIDGMGGSISSSFVMDFDEISGFPAARRWHIVIPLHEITNQGLFLYEVSITGKVERIVPQSYSITPSVRFNGVNPDDSSNCTVVNGMVKCSVLGNCSTPGNPRLFDCLKPDSMGAHDSNTSLFHLWQRKNVTVELLFQEPVIIDKIVWTFYHDKTASPQINGVPTGWTLTTFDQDDENRATVNVSNTDQIYSMVVLGSVVAQRWSITFSGETNNQWLFLSEVEIAGSNAEIPSPSPSATVSSNFVTSGVGTSAPLSSSTPSTTDSPAPPTPEPPSSPGALLSGALLYIVIGILAGVICLLILCVLAVILALVLKMCRGPKYNACESGKGTPGLEAVYSEIPSQDSNGLPLVNLSKLPGYSGGRQSNGYFDADYANNETIAEHANSGRDSPVYDEPDKYRINDLSKSMPMIARLTAPQEWIASQTRCRTLSPPAWYRDSDTAAGSVGSASSLPPAYTNGFTASPSTGQENGYHELQPSDGEDSEDSAFQGSVDPEHRYATLERVVSEEEDNAPNEEESLSEVEEEVSPDQCEHGVDSPTGIREPPYAEPQRLMACTSSSNEVRPHVYSQPDKSRKSLPLDAEDLETCDVPEDIDGSTAV